MFQQAINSPHVEGRGGGENGKREEEEQQMANSVPFVIRPIKFGQPPWSCSKIDIDNVPCTQMVLSSSQCMAGLI